MPSTYIYIYLEEGPVPAGILEMTGEGRSATARFNYGRRYLQRPDRLAIDPVQLPLHDSEVESAFIAPEGFAVFNGIRDASPDGWGRHLMDRAAGARPLSEYDYLVTSGDDRVGALAFGPDLSGPQRVFLAESDRVSGEELDLEGMLLAVQQYEQAEDLPEEHRRFLVRGSSLGGARPKAVAAIDGRWWIAKFGRQEDRYAVCRAEHAAMTLAAKAGLTVPTVRLERVLGKDIYLIERFDRVTHGKILHRTPFISGLTLTGAHESESSQQSYARLCEQLRLYGSNPREDSQELWGRMVFNILCNNTDDHLRNHGFLWDGKGWRLSPLYDVVPMPQVAQERDLAIGVGKAGRAATLQNAMSDAARFGLSQKEAVKRASEMQALVRTNWEGIFKKSGFSSSEIDRMRTCFAASEEKIKP